MKEKSIYKKFEFKKKYNKYCICIPVLNENIRIKKQIKKLYKFNIFCFADIIICDGNSTDNSNNTNFLKKFEVNTLLILKKNPGQSNQLRMGFLFALKRGYRGIITVDGNNKDSIENIIDFIKKLDMGYDFVQGSRFIKGGKAINTPFFRKIAIKYIHSPLINMFSDFKFTDTTNGFRAYSRKYLTHIDVKPLRKIFKTYELITYLTLRASQLNLKICEIPVKRKYPLKQKIPTKISFIKGNLKIFMCLIKTLKGSFNP
ncbi:MAG: glycosyltransferase family 2 protein [Candidatus Muiribacteriota bacterium]